MPLDTTDKDNETSATPEEQPAVTPTATTPMAATPLVNKGATPSLNLAPGAAASPLAPTPPAAAAPPAPVAPPAAAQATGIPTPAEAMADVAAADQKIQENLNKERAAQAEAAKKKAEVQSRVVAEQEKLDLKKGLLKPAEYQQIPYKKPTASNPVEQWGSPAMIFAMLGSLFTRGHAVTAMNAAAAALNGFKQGDEAAAKQSFEEWKAASQNALQAANFQQRAFDAAMKNIDSEERLVELRGTKEEKEIDASTNALIATYQHENAALAKKQGGLPGLLRFLETEKRNAADLATATKYIETLKSPEYAALVAQGDQLGAMKLLAETGDKDAKAKYDALATSKREGDRATREEIRDVRNSDEYKNADEQGKLGLLADAGDEKADKELVKLIGKQAAQKLDGSVDAETQRVNDEAIASYSAPMPPQSTRNKTAQKFYADTLARVKKINPEFDPSLKRTTDQVRSGWMDASKPAGKQIQTYNTITHHLTYLDELVDALKTGNQATINRVSTNVSAAIGNPNLAVTDVQAAQRVIADEITKGVIGSAGALVDREEMAKLFDPNQPLSVFKNNIKILQDLVGGRFAAAQKSFEAGTKREKNQFWELLEDDTKRAFGKQLGIPEDKIPKKPDTPETAAGAPATSPAAGAPAAGTAKPSPVPGYSAEAVANYIKQVRAMPGKENMSEEAIIDFMKRGAK
jgi:hypothetical protein